MQHTDSHSSSSSSSTATPTQDPLQQKMKSSSSRQSLEKQLNDLLQALFELSVVVYDFQPDGNKRVWDKINAILDHYRRIGDLKDGLDDFVPEEVINYIEHGRNPDMFTQAFVERAATENQFTHGKIKAVDEFRHLLSDEFAKSFPDLYDNTDIFDSASQDN
ncbi:RNA polymerase II mediator complex subunit [Apophysomyces sp. BC1034]|nr:RNA polymerase II mediator complex subunit [Apophysomyces sp. BC1015]KAG0178053.1 RNA polymerase II mediator complex subunit [Apophysomyces sp. BC1021]KAG0188329.1 RNA polymerase II mediator complex subunit [Apophysomyces sp. BC1034]